VQVTILGAESLGARSMATVVRTADRTVLIDPGVALAPKRSGFPPHPREVEAADRVREAVLGWLPRATDVVVTHFHGDHMPLADADPYQVSLSAFALPEKCRVWVPGEEGHSGRARARRRALVQALGRPLPSAEGKDDGVVACSGPFPHGGGGGGVMIVAVREGDACFVHASDTQLLSPEAVRTVLRWRPSGVYTSGPPLYLPEVTWEEADLARTHAARIAAATETLVIDHHPLRGEGGLRWVEDAGGISAAAFMGVTPALLEARRRDLWGRPPAGMY
jgi:predicted metallo-beta-lactamase superfamily hydrolase